MVSISLCMIVKNEEKVLKRCLESVQGIVDEINIIDTGSTDRTKEIAQLYTDRIFDFEWIDDFAAARNYSFSKATKDYILWLDADDIITPEDRQNFLGLKSRIRDTVDSVQMEYVLSKDAEGRITSSLKRNRLVKRERNFKWIGAVHEYLHVYGNIIPSDVSITHMSIKLHKTDRNLKIYEKQLENNQEFSPRDLYYYANECYEHKMYEKAIDLYRQFLGTEKGWVEDCIAAYEKGAESLLVLGRSAEAEKFLYESFLYDVPRANLCCKLGYIHLSQKKYHQAIFWYKTAAESDFERVRSTGALVNHAYYTWLPHLQLCVCYDRIGKYEQAYYHNEMARYHQPDLPSILQNKTYLEAILEQKGALPNADEIN